MQLFVGLGNPGPKYAQNRHNVGFMAVEAIARAHGFSPWRSKFQAEICEGRLGSEKLVLLKPQTFMNLSGQSVGAALRFYKLAPGDVTVFHDELDLAPGKVRVKTGGGHAGHNGLRSIHAHIGEAYRRVRLGIGHPGHKDRVSAYVLGDFPRSEATALDDLLDGLAEGAPALAADDAPGFLNAIARRRPPAAATTQDRRAGKAPTAGKAPKTAAGAKAPEEGSAAPEDTRSPLERLIDRFR